MLFDELAELTGQRNAIDARIVDVVAEIDGDRLWGNTGCRSVAALVAWKTGTSPTNAETIADVAHRLARVPALRRGDAGGPVVVGSGRGHRTARRRRGSDEHYARVGAQRLGHPVAHRGQTRTPTRPIRGPNRRPSISKHGDRATGSPAGGSNSARTTPRSSTPRWQSHHDALIAEWKRDHDTGARSQTRARRPRSPTPSTASCALVEAGWDADVARRPHGQHTTVVMHVDVKDRIAALHLGPLLTDADRQYLTL